MTKFDYSINPYNTFATFTSIQRNAYLTSSVGIAVAAFSKTFKTHKKKLAILSIIIIFYSSFYGIKNALDFSKYLELFDSNIDKFDSFTNEQIQSWKVWIIYGYIYSILSLVLVILLIFR
tara:strand:+ start:702 stop:1061 length:360 start_codon:yes stop_codon:yes gene_type:complete